MNNIRGWSKVKKLVSYLFLISVLFVASNVFAGERGAPVRDVGATSSATVITVAVSSNAALILSTGTAKNIYFTSGTANQFLATLPQTYMDGRMYLEIYNDSSIDIFCGFDSNVSTAVGSIYRGRRVPANGNSWSINGDLPNIYCVSNSSTGYSVAVTQAR